MSTQRQITWVDVNGLTRVTVPRVAASATTLQAAMLNISNADVQQFFESAVTVNAAPAPVAATFQTVVDQVILLFQTPAGNIVKLTVPAPQSSIFLADGQTVNPANAFIVALVAVALLNLVDTAGNLVTLFLGGTRS